MKFKIGNNVEMIDGIIKGQIINIVRDIITIIDNDGFKRNFLEKELILVNNDNLTRLDLTANVGDKEKRNKASNQNDFFKTLKKNKLTISEEVDLHIEKITGNYFCMSNAEILETQIKFFRKKLNNIIHKKNYNIVFIHGKGEGVLKQHIINELDQYQNLYYRDASFLDYGEGATLVIIGSKK